MALTAGQTTLGTIRATVRQRADMVNSLFVTEPELNGYINSSYQELYDLLVQKYGDNYYVATPYSFTTDGVNDTFPLPADFYKLLGVDLQLSGNSPNGYITLRPFNFAERNRYIIPNYTTPYGTSNLRYRLLGNGLWLTPRASSGQTVRLWYVPRLTLPVNDADVIDGVSGWEEYIVVDAVIKCKLKEESDPSVELALKQELVKRIESAAENRDAGSPPTVVDTQWSNGGPGGFGYPGGGSV